MVDGDDSSSGVELEESVEKSNLVSHTSDLEDTYTPKLRNLQEELVTKKILSYNNDATQLLKNFDAQNFVRDTIMAKIEPIRHVVEKSLLGLGDVRISLN
jgi:hypothetical protein